MPNSPIKHGHSRHGKQSKTLKSWLNAKARCFCKTHPKYAQYGARGITMDAEWVNNFNSFLRDMGECPPGLSLDRIDNDGNYQPGNCRWATPSQQTRNRRATLSVVAGGMEMPLIQALEQFNSPIAYRTVRHRILRGWSFEKAISSRPMPGCPDHLRTD